MVVFLTSSFVEFHGRDDHSPAPLKDVNGFKKNLEFFWPETGAHFLVFASDPEDSKMTDGIKRDMYDAFSLAGLLIQEIKTFDARNLKDSSLDAKEILKNALEWADVLFLAGGHVPTQNAFMKKTGLRELLEDRSVFDGLLIALSAGSMNSAGEVYMAPELESEINDPGYVRFSEGLGLTSLNIIPHLDYIKKMTVSGKRMIEDVLSPDSFNRPLFMIPDGSYFIIRNGVTEFFGNGEILDSGSIFRFGSGIINTDNLKFRLNPEKVFVSGVKISKNLLDGGYDLVTKIDSEGKNIEFYHISTFFTDYDIIPVFYGSFDDFCRDFAEKMIVDDEKEVFLQQGRMPVILDEIRRNGSFVRTIHVETRTGVDTESLRIVKIDGSNTGYLCYISNISFVVDHDILTDEYSRPGFIAKTYSLLETLDLNEGYSAIYTNIKGFKAINELFGVHCGDMVIFTQRDAIRRYFDPLLLARIENDHFMAIVKDSYLTDENLRKFTETEYKEIDRQLPLNIRVGIYHITKDTESVRQILDYSKLAENLISEKTGCQYAVYDEDMKRKYVDRNAYVAEVDRALEKGEFVTYYQPVVDTETLKIVSAEALIRWKHPEKGLLSPGVFIPAFEEGGMISKIDKFVVENVIAFNIYRKISGKNYVPCAINLSRVDFYNPLLLDSIRTNLRKNRENAGLIKMEITESAYVVLEKNDLQFLNELKEMGVDLLLDDFGSGMSSMSTLESFDFSVVKLDMGFISKIGASTKNEAIIRTVIELSHAIGAKVVAEGVEKREQYEFLKEAGCDMIQGFLFYKPMPEADFAALLDKEQ